MLLNEKIVCTFENDWTTPEKLDILCRNNDIEFIKFNKFAEETTDYKHTVVYRTKAQTIIAAYYFECNICVVQISK